jgi:F420-dependent oxidoreductase-like protein
MDDKLIGIYIAGTKVKEIQAAIEHAEKLGIQATWMTTGGAQLDSITTFASAAEQTQNIKFGTSVVPTYPRHPLVMVQQAQVVAQLAPGRFRLGVGPSHRPLMRTMGIQLNNPLANLREYLRILKALLQNGTADFDGEFYQAHDSVVEPVHVPVMASALQRGSFEICGAEADGAISWVSPGRYLRDVALPAMKKGAEQAGRPVPPLIAHVPVCVHENVDEVRAAFREQFSGYPTLPFYRRMLIAAGYPEASKAVWSDAMIDGLVIYGDEAKAAEGLQELLGFGATEILAHPVLVGADRSASLERTLRLLGQVAQSTAK